jgi:deazaflavin-dependent oxidoreductase (nitroreductase family)
VTAAHERSLASLVERRSRRRALGVLIGWFVDLPVIGSGLARLIRAPTRRRFLSTSVTRIHAAFLRLSRGRLRRSWIFAAGQPVLALTTTGRKTGLPRSTAVACFAHGSDLVLAAMNLGMTRNPGWALNLQAHPAATIDIDGKRIPVTARQATGTEAAELWRRWLELQPSARSFRELAGREIPLFVLAWRSQ